MTPLLLLVDLAAAVLLAHLRLVPFAAAGLAVLVLLAPPTRCSKEKVYLTAMRYDLRSIATVAEARRAEGLSTSAEWDQVGLSVGVRLVRYEPTLDGFHAVVAYPDGTLRRCELRYSWGTEPQPTCEM